MLAALILALLSQSDPLQPQGPIFSSPARMKHGFVEPGVASFATTSGQGMGTECSCSPITGSRTEVVTVARSTVAECVSGSGQLVTKCPANTPRVSKGISTESQLGFFVESAGANWVGGSARDLSNAAYVKSSMTCARTAIGMRGDANGASTCTASGTNATVLQTVDHTTITGQPTVHACGSFFIKRRTGTGTVSVTYDGSTFTDITASLSTSLWKRVAKNTTIAGDRLISVSAMCATTAASPVVGLKLATSADAVDVDFFQVETNDINENGFGIFTATTPIDAVGGVSRAADTYTTPKPAGLSDSAGCVGWTSIWGVKSFTGPQISMGDTAGFFGYMSSPTDEFLYDGTNNPGPAHPVLSVNVPFSAEGDWSVAANMLSGSTSGGGPLTSAYDGTIIGSGSTVWLGSQFHGGSVQNWNNGLMRNVILGRTPTACRWSNAVSDGGWIEYVDWEWPGTTTSMIPITNDFAFRTLSDGGIPIGAIDIYDTHPDYDGGVVVEDAGILFARGKDAGPNIWTNIPYVANGFPSTSAGVKYEICFSPLFSDTQWTNGMTPDWDGTIYLADFNNVTDHAATFILGADFQKDLYIRTVGTGPSGGAQETFILDGGTIGWTAGQQFCVSGEWIPVTDGGTGCDARIRYNACGSTPVPSCHATTVVGSDIGLGVCPNTASILTLAQRQSANDPSNLSPSTVHVSAVRAWAP